MHKILEATCHNGDLILNEKLSVTMEGKSFRVILLEESDASSIFLKLEVLPKAIYNQQSSEVKFYGKASSDKYLSW